MSEMEPTVAQNKEEELAIFMVRARALSKDQISALYQFIVAWQVAKAETPTGTTLVWRAIEEFTLVAKAAYSHPEYMVSVGVTRSLDMQVDNAKVVLLKAIAELEDKAWCYDQLNK